MSVARISGAAAALFLFASAAAQAQPVLNASTLPNSRTADIGATTTFFAAMANSGDAAATGCSVALAFDADPALSLTYIPTDGAGGFTGPADTPVAIAAGATQQFFIGLAASSAFEGAVPLVYGCGADTAVSVSGLNDFFFIATDDPIPDIITIGATPSGDGILTANANGRAILAVAAINIGDGDPPPAKPEIGGVDALEADITVRPSYTNFTEGGQHPLMVCPTVLGTGACSSPFAAETTVVIGDSPVAFAVDLTQFPGYGVPFFPGEYRLHVQFFNSDGDLVGSTSVAPASASPGGLVDEPTGLWEVFVRDDSDSGSRFTRNGTVFFPPDGSMPMGGVNRQPLGPPGYTQPLTLDGTLDTAGAIPAYDGCAHFLDTGMFDEAYDGWTMVFEPSHFGRGVYDSAGGAGCAPGAKPEIRAPQIDPVSSSGRFFFAPVFIAEFDGDSAFEDLLDDLPMTVTNPSDPTETYGSVSLTRVGSTDEWSLSASYRTCTLSGVGTRYGGYDGLALKLSFSVSACGPSAPIMEGSGEGFVAFQTDDLGGGSTLFTGDAAIFTDGFESGDTSRWSLTTPP